MADVKEVEVVVAHDEHAARCAAAAVARPKPRRDHIAARRRIFMDMRWSHVPKILL